MFEDTTKEELRRQCIEFIFQKPLEPIFTTRVTRDGKKGVFNLTPQYFSSRYVENFDTISKKFGRNVEKSINIGKLENEPNISFAFEIDHNQQFSLFNTRHLEIASRLITILTEEKDVDEFIKKAIYIRDRVNAFMFQYAFAVAVVHRPDTSHLDIPPVATQFPANFIEPSVLGQARAEDAILQETGDRIHITIPRNFTASDREEEQRLAYFREDIAVNMHHWHWHLVYPATGPEKIVKKDRRGELFYYMHQQLMARYNIERFSNNLQKVKPLNNFHDPIQEGYFPKILSSLTKRTYTGRIAKTKLRDLQRTDLVSINELERWRNRIFDAIDMGYVIDKNHKQIPLDEHNGINILGDIVEASDLSLNKQFYGNIHNMGHNLISFAHDPENRYLEDIGVMGDVTTAMRDPVFYRWHGFIDSIFQKYKLSLPPYNKDQLYFNDIVIEDVQTLVKRKSKQFEKEIFNALFTGWHKSDIDLAAALDFGTAKSVYATFTHLTHLPFDYKITVNNNGSAIKAGTCRIFLCPKTDERGTKLQFNEQRLLAIEMDKFTVNLHVGTNIIKRRSIDSNVTIKFDRIFKPVGEEYRPDDPEELSKYLYCRCGWPEYMLVPKGKVEGMSFDMFVMIFDYTDDVVEDGTLKQETCDDNSSFCGLKNKRYPDKRAMGYPFDRVAPDSIRFLSNFVAEYQNMKLQEIQVMFEDKFIKK